MDPSRISGCKSQAECVKTRPGAAPRNIGLHGVEHANGSSRPDVAEQEECPLPLRSGIFTQSPRDMQQQKSLMIRGSYSELGSISATSSSSRRSRLRPSSTEAAGHPLNNLNHREIILNRRVLMPGGRFDPELVVPDGAAERAAPPESGLLGPVRASGSDGVLAYSILRETAARPEERGIEWWLHR